MRDKTRGRPPKKDYTVSVGAIYSSEAEVLEVDRYILETNQVKGRAYAQAMIEKMDRDRAAGRWE